MQRMPVNSIQAFSQHKVLHKGLKQQSGSVLLVGIVFMVAMAIMAISALSGVTTQERRAANSSAKNQAERAAMSAVSNFLHDLRAGEDSAHAQMLAALSTGVGHLSEPVQVAVPNSNYAVKIQFQKVGNKGDLLDSIDADTTNNRIESPILEIVAVGYNVNNPDISVEVRRGFKYK